MCMIGLSSQYSVHHSGVAVLIYTVSDGLDRADRWQTEDHHIKGTDRRRLRRLEDESRCERAIRASTIDRHRTCGGGGSCGPVISHP